MLHFPGPDKILMLAILALVVLGPTRLPQAARTAGKWIGELRKLTSKFQEEMRGSLAEPKDAITAAVGDLRGEIGGFRNEISGLRHSLTTRPTDVTASPGAGNGDTNGAAFSQPSGMAANPLPYAPPPGLPDLPPAPDDPSLN